MPLPTLDLDATAVLFHDVLDYRQSQPDPKAFGAVQRLVDLFVDVRRYTRTRIVEDHFDATVAFPCPHGEGMCFGVRSLHALPDHCLAGVVEDVDDDAPESIGIEGCDHIRFVESQPNRDPRGQSLLVQDVFQPSIEEDGLRLELRYSGEIEKLIDDSVAAHHISFDPIQRALCTRISSRFIAPQGEDRGANYP